MALEHLEVVGFAAFRVHGATLHLSRDGVTWEPQQVQVSVNSNGSPILKSDGKEYARCQ